MTLILLKVKDDVKCEMEMFLLGHFVLKIICSTPMALVLPNMLSPNTNLSISLKSLDLGLHISTLHSAKKKKKKSLNQKPTKKLKFGITDKFKVIMDPKSKIK